MPYHHLTSMERGQIQAWLTQGLSQRAIAVQLGRSASTVCRELTRNRAPSKAYCAARAQKRYEQVRKACRRTTSLSEPALRRYLFDKMTQGWSPEQIAGRLWLDFPGQPRMRVSPETIYRSLYTDEKLGNPLIGCLRRRRPRRRKRGERRPTKPFIPNRIGIEARPARSLKPPALRGLGSGLARRSQPAGAPCLPWWNVSPCCYGLHCSAPVMPTASPRPAIDQLRRLPPHWTKTITFDNGSEFAHHEHIAQALGLDTYFANPYAAYERGTNENTNGLLRQYLPKNTNFREIAESQLQSYVRQLNNRPRKKLGYRTPNEVFDLQAVALAP